MFQFFKKNPHWLACLVAIVLVSGYWFFWATDRYVSRATVVLESPQIAPPEMSFSSILTGTGGSQDLLLLREHLLSVDMLKRVQAQLDFRSHYSQHGDIFARLHDAEAPIEELHQYYLKRVQVEMDEYAGVLNVTAQAYTPEFAHDFVQLLLAEGERHMNNMGQRLAQEQVRFLEKQVAQLEKHFDQTRQALLDYQNKNGLVSPTGTVESLNSVIATLEGRLAVLKAQKNALASYQSTRSSEMVRISSEIKALNEQIEHEHNRLAGQTGTALNTLSSEYKMLELRAQFAQESYSGALAALENTRIEAARKLKQVSVLQSPLMPEYPTKPDRLYNASVFAIVTVFLAFILSMLIMIVRDHRD